MPSTGSADIGGLRSLIVVLALGLLALGGLLQRQRRAA
jgi:MYXO-CTERM domain-containing protein